MDPLVSVRTRIHAMLIAYVSFISFLRVLRFSSKSYAYYHLKSGTVQSFDRSMFGVVLIRRWADATIAGRISFNLSCVLGFRNL